jgi:methyl-accepting chemotaxis protein
MLNFFRDMKISKKLPLIMLLLALINSVAISTIGAHFAEKAVLKESNERLEAINADHVEGLTNFLSSISEDLKILSTNETVLNALSAFTSGYTALSSENKTEYLQDAYIKNNPNEIGKKHLLDMASDGSDYSTAHAKYHPWLRQFLVSRDYYDIFLFDTNGNLVYTVFKEMDFATHAETGQWKDTDLMKLFREIKTNPKKDDIHFKDFAKYAPSNNVPAGFIGTGIFDGSGNLIGVLAFQMPIARMNDYVQTDDGLGKTGDNVLVGSDFLYRTDSRFIKDGEPSSVLSSEFKSPAVELALKGEDGILLAPEEGGDLYLSSYAPIDFEGTRWAMITKIKKSEILAEINKLKLYVYGPSLIALLVVGLISFAYSKNLTNPINNMVLVMGRLAHKDYETQVPAQDRKDEIGDMGRAVQIFKENGLAVQRMEREQEELKKQAELEKVAAMNKLADDFDSRTSGIIESLAAAATEMQATASQMTNASGNTSQASALVAAAATQADSNVQTVAAAAEELSASSSEIARQISTVAQKANRASQEATTTSKQVGELNTLADSIGEVVSAIKDIAEQTNLLALNATIEAARAGEAGKGFAVVADEVKKLAMETAQKTEQIDERVVRIQQAIRSSVEAVQRIIEDVRQIDESTTTVASAVEEQNAATAEIGRNVSEASSGTQQVAQNIVDVQRNAEETGLAATTVLTASEELSRISNDLKVQVAKFLVEIRTNK